MQKSISTRLTVVLLALFTLAAIVFASLNLVKDAEYQKPTDGIWWMEAHGGLEAQRVPAGSPGEHAGIKPADVLLAAGDHPTPRLASLVREWFRAGVYRRIDYTLLRSGVRIDASVILIATDRSQYEGLRLVALVYLLIGLYVLFRRWTAPHATHFYIFCLASFVLYAFHSTGKLNAFDWTIYWGNILAGALQPALFLHFAIAFPENRLGDRRSVRLHRWLMALVYLPSVLVIAVQAFAFLYWSATERLSHRLDQVAVGYLAAYYVLAAIVFFSHYRFTQDPLRRQQLKWLTRGTLLAVIPFTLLNVIPFLADWPVPSILNKIAGLCLVFLPLTFSWAIVRYRLMDVDLIFKRGVAYTLATASLIGLYFGAVALAAELIHKNLPSFGSWGLIATIIITAQLFDPLKRAIQARVDRVFDRRRYDYRQTLIEFGRGLSSETDLDAVLASVNDRLTRTLLVSRVALFLNGPRGDGPRGRYTLAAAKGLDASLMPVTGPAAKALDLNFLKFDSARQDSGRTDPAHPAEHGETGSHLFFENPSQALYLSESERAAAAALDLHYYLPCRVQQRTIAIVGLGRTTSGDFLSSEDMELLESLASYIGIAIQNARLYASLAQKASEYERLKEFNENIVESINVGILAIGLDETVESWNAQMEVMFAMPRVDVLNQPIGNIFPPEFMAEFRHLKDEPGVHNLYKFPLPMPTGETRTANIAIAPLVSRNFSVVGRIILVDDITTRMQLESQLAQAEKLSSIGLLAAGVAHEVNTPLAVISSYTQMLAKEVRGNERLAPLLDRITSQTFRASGIVNSLLNFSRTGSTEFSEIDLNTVIRDTLTLLEHQFKTAAVHLDVNLKPELPRIIGNADKLQQVFLNLFLNAKDAMTAGGSLQVATEVNGRVGVLISDTGAGIAPEHMQRIYDPFFTTKTAPSEGQRRGTGLGLAVTYGIIQEHSGRIQVESAVGQGTTFRLEFPAVRKAMHV
ncbi:MAG: ATP-binding protein [Acidobacteriaceae bacterium]